MIIKATKEEYRALMAKKLVDFADSYRACLRSRRVNALTGERIISKLRYQIRMQIIAHPAISHITRLRLISKNIKA